MISPDAYKELDGWKIAQPRDGLPRGAWWEIFDDPQLNALEARVSISNQNLAVAEAQFREARALVREARAGYFPTVTLGLGYTRSRQSTTVTSGSGGASSSGTSGVGGSSGRPSPTSSWASTSRGSWTSGDGSAARSSRTGPARRRARPTWKRRA